MNIRVLHTSLVLLLSLFLLAPSAGAMDISFGANTFFAWWSPAYENYLRHHYGPPNPREIPANSSFHMDPAFLLGPSAAVTLPGGFSVSSVFLWSSWYHFRSEYVRYNSLNGYLLKNHFEGDNRKWDLDVLLHYSLNRYCRLFAGLKYQGYRRNLNWQSYWIQIVPSYSLNASANPEILHNGWGPGIGASFTFHLGGSLYLLVNGSLLYLYTTYRWDLAGILHALWIYNAVGVNGTVSLAYYIEAASVTLSLGFRYQFLHYILWDGKSNDWHYRADRTPVMQGSFDVLTSDDHFYGITLSAVYTLNIF